MRTRHIVAKHHANSASPHLKYRSFAHPLGRAATKQNITGCAHRFSAHQRLRKPSPRSCPHMLARTRSFPAVPRAAREKRSFSVVHRIDVVDIVVSTLRVYGYDAVAGLNTRQCRRASGRYVSYLKQSAFAFPGHRGYYSVFYGDVPEFVSVRCGLSFGVMIIITLPLAS